MLEWGGASRSISYFTEPLLCCFRVAFRYTAAFLALLPSPTSSFLCQLSLFCSIVGALPAACPQGGPHPRREPRFNRDPFHPYCRPPALTCHWRGQDLPVSAAILKLVLLMFQWYLSIRLCFSCSWIHESEAPLLPLVSPLQTGYHAGLVRVGLRVSPPTYNLGFMGYFVI